MFYKYTKCNIPYKYMLLIIVNSAIQRYLHLIEIERPWRLATECFPDTRFEANNRWNVLQLCNVYIVLNTNCKGGICT